MQTERTVSGDDAAIPQGTTVEYDESLLDLVDEVIAVARRLCQEAGTRSDGIDHRVGLVVPIDR